MKTIQKTAIFSTLLFLFTILLSTDKKQSTPPIIDVYAGRYDKEKDYKYNLLGLPQDRLYLTASEWRGDHVRDNILLYTRFKTFKKIHCAEWLEHMGQEMQKEYNLKQFQSVPASLVLAQCILESNWGLSRLAVPPNNNLFGHKHKKNNYNKRFIVGYTEAKDDGPRDKFSKFKSRFFSLRAHSYLLINKYGKRIKGRPTLNKWLAALCGGLTLEQSKKHVFQNGGTVYATSCYKGSECYAQKLKRIIKFYNLKRFDNKNFK
tara:strand:+ start:1565 stop:2350 length:786 start_codon:yes stop_codon:yes gene_type:complete